jgi:cell division protein FtsN
MENEWVKLTTVDNMAEAEMVRGMLAENGIESNIMNKEDSSFLIGYVQIFVSEDKLQKAKTLIHGEDKPE